MDRNLEELSLTGAQGRAPHREPGGPAAANTCSCLSHAKEYGFTLKLMQETEASHPGQGVMHACSPGWAAVAAEQGTDRR